MKVKLKNEILKEHSKSNTTHVAKMINGDENLFQDLLEIFFDYNEMDVARKAAWVVRECVSFHPFLINAYIPKLISYVQRNHLHPAIKRNIMAILEKTEIPAYLTGKLTEICFQIIASGQESIAVKAYAMGIMSGIVEKHPDLKHELRLLIMDVYPYESKGFQSRARKILENHPG